MRIRQILLVHPTRSIRGLIKKFVYAELNDVAFSEAESAEEALSELALHDIDVLIVSTKANDVSLSELKGRVSATDRNTETPCIILSEEDNGTDTSELLRQGFEHVVMMRVRPADLIKKINAVCNPRNWRKDKRFYLPQAEVAVYSQGQRIEGLVINISRGGVLAEMVTFEPNLLVQSDLLLSLHLPERPDFDSVFDLPCKLLQMNITEWHHDNSPAAMRATFVFLDMAAEKRAALEEVLQFAVEEEDGNH